MSVEIGGIDVDEYRQHLLIDKDTLDENISVQPDLFFRVSTAYALACSKRDQAKEDLKQSDAELDLDIRHELQENEIKFTEGKIANLITSHERHVEAAGVYLDTCEEANILGALKDAFSQRSYMLRELVELYTVGYYADPDHITGKRDMRDEADRKRLDDSVSKKHRKKRKES